MSFEDEVSKKLKYLREKGEKAIRVEVDRKAAEELKRSELSGKIENFASYLKRVEFPYLPLYVVAGRKGGLFTV